MNSYTTLAYTSAHEMLFGTAQHPVMAGHDVVIGGGAVLPEVKFTLPSMLIQEETWSDIRKLYREMTTQVLQKAVSLNQAALVLEFEQLYEMTLNPEWGATLTGDLKDVMNDFHQKHGLRSALRVTVADIREQERPPKMRTGEPLQKMLRAFELCAEAGADILAIESTGGKEVSDHALLEADIDGLAFALGVLARRATWPSCGVTSSILRSATASSPVAIRRAASATQRCNWHTRRCCRKSSPPSSA